MLAQRIIVPAVIGSEVFELNAGHIREYRVVFSQRHKRSGNNCLHIMTPEETGWPDQMKTSHPTAMALLDIVRHEFVSSAAIVDSDLKQ